MVAIGNFVRDLSAIPEREFTHQNVLEFLRRNRVELESLSPYLYFAQEHYTRNLIQRTPLFDLLAICWEPGQQSPIHNHCNQSCWMAMAFGRVQVHNFKLIQKNPTTGFCELASSIHYLIDAENPQEVDPVEPIHLVANPRSFGSRAITLHIYSKPYDTCEVYDLKRKHYQEEPLLNTTEYGVIKSNWKLEKVDACLLASSGSGTSVSG
ncbi:MAG: cysteine dioxygenase [Terriglobia bacterium]